MSNWSAYRWGEAAVAAVLAALGLYLIAASTAMPSGSLAQPGTNFVPLAVGILLAVVAAAIIAGLGLEGADRVAAVAPPSLDAGITFAVLIAVALVFESIGALATFAGLLAVLHFTFARAEWWKSILFGLAGSAAAWAIFVRVLSVSLPGPGF